MRYVTYICSFFMITICFPKKITFRRKRQSLINNFVVKVLKIKMNSTMFAMLCYKRFKAFKWSLWLCKSFCSILVLCMVDWITVHCL